ncbi:MAG: thioredoxin domain-containing protein [Alphaproteobacteria bacterium]|nr:thioredoxin domain-containing protein [Alphaproteobacteria bacterium]
MLRKMLVLLAVSAAVVPASAQAKFFKFGMNEEEVKTVIKDYLLENPEIIKEAMDNYARRQEEAKKQAAVAKLKSHRAALERDANTPVIGNPDGDVTIVEFFDYNCGYCKLMFPKVLEYVQNDGNIRWVLKDLPSLGATSDLAARAGLAAEKQGKYFEMHQAMITHKGALTEADIVSYAKSAGLNMKKFEKDRKDKALDKILNANRTLAGQFEFYGIPDFIIGDFISQGAMMGDELDKSVAAIREKAAK